MIRRCLVLALLTALPAAAEIILTGRPATPGQAPPARAVNQAEAATKNEPHEALLLPYYVVDATNPGGLTTLIAVRNALFDTITLEITYRPRTGGTLVESFTLLSRETLTRNLRDIAPLPSTGGGFKEGWAEIVALDPGTGNPVTDIPIHGDAFVVTPEENFATGDALPPVASLCLFWDTRFAVGPPFDDTEFRMLVPGKAPGPTTVVATVAVYDEPGDFYGEVDISSDSPVGVITASDILAELAVAPIFGVFEWTFSDNDGYLTQETRAEGRYAVGWTPACIDPAFPTLLP